MAVRLLVVWVALALSAGCSDAGVGGGEGDIPAPDAVAGDGGAEDIDPTDAADQPDGEDAEPAGPCDGLPDGTPCEDGDVCTLDDVCDGGQCVGGVNRSCDDQGPCQPGVCDEALGCVYETLADGAACSVACFDVATCQTGACVVDGDSEVQCPTPDSDCIAELRCATATGDCTVEIYAPNEAPCDQDDDSCSLDACDGAGTCEATGELVNCEAESIDQPCWTHTCLPKDGTCVKTLFIVGGSCNDNSPCTESDTCIVTEIGQEACLGTPIDVDDGNPCTDDWCEAGVIEHAPLDGAGCPTGDSCTPTGTCADGACLFEGCGCADDGDCEPAANQCAGVVICDTSLPIAACVLDPTTAVTCDPPASPCHTSGCDPTTGACTELPLLDGSPCNDQNACTGGDTCLAGACGGTMMTCDDGNPCTADSCDAGLGCQTDTVAGGTDCDDGDPCTWQDQCAGGLCTGEPLTCDDGNPCTNDICDGALGCTYPATPGSPACNDGDGCTTGDQCANGVCGGVPLDCDDGNPCTDDSCDGATGCQAWPNTDPCAGGTCDGGVCEPTGCEPIAYGNAGQGTQNGWKCSDVCGDLGGVSVAWTGVDEQLTYCHGLVAAAGGVPEDIVVTPNNHSYPLYDKQNEKHMCKVNANGWLSTSDWAGNGSLTYGDMILCRCQITDCPCTPGCGAKACGVDDCGNPCGECPGDVSCFGGSCGCAGVTCGASCCDEGESCEEGVCVAPQPPTVTAGLVYSDIVSGGVYYWTAEAGTTQIGSCGQPWGLHVVPPDLVYVACISSDSVERLTLAGEQTTVHTSDSAFFNARAITQGPDGSMYIAGSVLGSWNVWKLHEPSQSVTGFSMLGLQESGGIFFGEEDALYWADFKAGGMVVREPPGGPVETVIDSFPSGFTLRDMQLGMDGNLLIVGASTTGAFRVHTQDGLTVEILDLPEMGNGVAQGPTGETFVLLAGDTPAIYQRNGNGWDVVVSAGSGLGTVRVVPGESEVGEAACIQPGDDAWTDTGQTYCAGIGLLCAGTTYYGASPSCDGSTYTGCWGSTPLGCCSSPMSGHAGSPGGASALWDCVTDCPTGSELGGDACVDVDECALGTDDCHVDATCINKQGTYQCLCHEGYTGDGVDCVLTDPDFPACITSGDEVWTWSGSAYCQSFDLTCQGVAYYGSNETCSGSPYTGCWGGDVNSCCGASMAGHAGSPPGTSALWTCVP